MKNKKNIKILLPVVLIIWGLVIYNIVDAFSSEEIAGSKMDMAHFKAPKIKEKEVFTLLPIDSDPFLGTMYTKPKTKVTSRRNPVQEIVWPAIDYEGVISGKTFKSTIFIISINGQQHLVKKGDTLQGLKVIKGNTKLIKLKYKRQTKEFPIM